MEEREGYQAFCDMERPEVVGTGVDPTTGWRYEDRLIGMTRNAKAANRRRLRIYLDPAPHVVLDQNVPLRGWYKAKVEAPGVRPRPCYTEALLTQPYGGACPVRCFFCYVNNGLRGYRGQGVTVVDPAYPEKIGRQLDRMRTGAAGYISSFTEPFQPRLEPHYRVTERLAHQFVRVGLPVFFLTRQVPPDWVVDVLRANPYSYQQFSVNTPDPDTWRRLSPRAAPLPAILDAIRALRAAGVYLSIQVNPILPGVVRADEALALVDLLADAGAHHLIFKFVEVVHSAERALRERVRRVFPDRADEFDGLLTDSIGHVKTVAEGYRVDLLGRLQRVCTARNLTMGLCYEYAYRRDAKGAVIDRTGESLGPRFTTGDQCHGRRVPVFSRPSADVAFAPIPDCPPGGCLYCADEAGAPCGSALLARATALRPADLNRVAWEAHHGPIAAALGSTRKPTSTIQAAATTQTPKTGRARRRVPDGVAPEATAKTLCTTQSEPTAPPSVGRRTGR